MIGRPDKTTRVGKHLQESLKQEIIPLIREFSDIFAWEPNDMLGIPETIARHSLHIIPKPHPICQKKRVFSEEKQKAVDEEFNRLLDAKFIKPVIFSTWIVNVVLLRKKNGKWRMCIDYSDLNKACPKDFYPFPNINQLIDTTAGHELLSFMNDFSGYNQIKMDCQDWEQTAFITHIGVFGFRNMPFGLINAMPHSNR